MTAEAGEPKEEDYIHVRAQRGQATNSHSLAERVRLSATPLPIWDRNEWIIEKEIALN